MMLVTLRAAYAAARCNWMYIGHDRVDLVGTQYAQHGMVNLPTVTRVVSGSLTIPQAAL